MDTDATTRKTQTLSYTKTVIIFLITGLLTFASNIHVTEAQNCPNVDFSSGTFANWQGRTGTCCPINLPTPGIVPGRQTIIAAPGVDPFTGGGLVLPAPGFAQVARLGNSINGAEAEGLSYTILVDPTNALFIYTYAVVLEDPGHTPAEQPRFELQVRDQNNNIIPCTFYEVAAGAGIPGFQTVGGVVWKNWEQVGVDLSAYMGQTITIEARTGDCALGGHFGYGYLVGECQPLTINLSFCSGAASANLGAPNGFASYQWSTGQTTQNITISNPTIGQVITCTVTSVTGCQAVLSTTLTPINVTGTISSTNVSCFGGNNGSATVTPAGGTGPYTYNWAPSGGTGATANNLIAGTYTVTITENGNGCTGTSTVTITQPAAPVSIAGNITNVNCFSGNTGVVDITPSGGTPGYTYNWNNGSTLQDVSGLTVGTYSVTVTDVNGCTAAYSANVTQPATALTNTVTNTNTTCFNGNNGAVNITPSGGTPGYTYLWSNGSTTQDISGLTAANYTVTITDGLGCSTSSIGVVTQPTAVNPVPTAYNVQCFGGNNGSIVLITNGGTPGYTFAWSNGATTPNISGLTVGTYSVIATDVNGCTGTASAFISQPGSAMTVNGITTNINCFGGATGSVDVTVTGGSPPYSYTWSNGATTQDISGLTPGTYNLSVTDLSGCVNNSFSATITQPAAPVSVTGTSTNVTCFGANNGAVNITPSGGTAPYSYNWNIGATTEDISGLAPGTYSVVITDVNGCAFGPYVTIVTQPTAVNPSPTVYDVTCYGGNNGSIVLTTNGGVPPYNFQWSNGATTPNISGLTVGTYSVIATDASGCTGTASVFISQPASALNISGVSTNIDCFGNFTGAINVTVTGGSAPYSYSWNTGATSQDLSGLNAGTYNLTVTDLSGCVNNSFAATITQPAAALTVSGINNNILCFGGATGSIDITPSGGTSPYTYTWNNGATTQDLIGLSPGSYNLTITDANGCTNNSYVGNITQPSTGLNVSGTSANVACYGLNTGSIDLTVIGGTSPYTYAWNNGSTAQDQSAIAAGFYAVTVTDANGCTNTSYSVYILQPTVALTVTGNPTDPNCYNASNGSIDITPGGGTIPYTYQWSSGSDMQDIMNLTAGGYTVTVTDGNGCTINGQWSLANPPMLDMFGNIQASSCYGIKDAEISLLITGGVPAYTIVWNTGATGQTLSNIGPGNYSVTVTDAHGCSNSGSYTVPVTPPLNVEVTTDSLYEIWLGESVELTAEANGGSGDFTYTWGPDDYLSCVNCSTTVASPLNNMNYGVTVTDANGCTAVASVHIDIMFAMYIPNTFTPNGDGDNDQFYAVSGSVKSFTLRIFDRWGEEVFSTNDIHVGWDGIYHGIECKQDVYVYRVEATFLNGKYEELVGQVNLLR